MTARLADLVASNGTLAAGHGNMAIAGLAADSREVKPGYLFAALAGSRTDGARFIADALARGAVAVLAAIRSPWTHRSRWPWSGRPNRGICWR